MAEISVPYIVDDVDAAVAFYRDRLSFTVEMHPRPVEGAEGVARSWSRTPPAIRSSCSSQHLP